MTVVGLRMSKILPLACQWQVVIHSPTYFRNYGILRIPEIIVNSSNSEKYTIDANGQNLKVQNTFLLSLKWSKKWSKARKLFLQWFSWNHRSTSNLYCGKKRNFFFTDVATWRLSKFRQCGLRRFWFGLSLGSIASTYRELMSAFSCGSPLTKISQNRTGKPWGGRQDWPGSLGSVPVKWSCI